MGGKPPAESREVDESADLGRRPCTREEDWQALCQEQQKTVCVFWLQSKQQRQQDLKDDIISNGHFHVTVVPFLQGTGARPS